MLDNFNNIKTCKKCNENLPQEAFTKVKRLKSGYSSVCKKCTNVASRKYKRKYFLENKDKINSQRRKDYAENPEQRLEWSKNNPEKVKEYKKKWKDCNKHNLITGDAARRARMKLATPAYMSEFDKFLINEIYDLASKRSSNLGIKFSVDHIVPIMSEIVCGLHAPCNLQIIPFKENIIKSNKFWPDMPDKEL